MDESKVLHLYYTNYKGETRLRKVTPLSIHFGVSPWHPKEQWLMEVIDAETGEARTFALEGILRPLGMHHLFAGAQRTELPEPCLFWVDNDGGYDEFCLVTKEYFDKEGCLSDRGFPHHSCLPAGFRETSESSYEFEGETQVGVEQLVACGFTQIDNPF